MRHILEAQQFDREMLSALFAKANGWQAEQPMRGRIMASLFYEPSTRTRLSFESAMLRLGGSVITTENAREFSSAIKGESLEDSIRVISQYADVIVLRHYEEGSAARAAAVSSVPIINAGDGPGQHPTQALLDLYTIQRELGRLNDITIAFVGDLKHGRTVRSLAYLLSKYDGVQMRFISPCALELGEDLVTYLRKRDVRFIESARLEDARDADVVYMTRIQAERFEWNGEQPYRMTLEEASKLKAGAIIMHAATQWGNRA